MVHAVEAGQSFSEAVVAVSVGVVKQILKALVLGCPCLSELPALALALGQALLLKPLECGLGRFDAWRAVRLPG